MFRLRLKEEISTLKLPAKLDRFEEELSSPWHQTRTDNCRKKNQRQESPWCSTAHSL